MVTWKTQGLLTNWLTWLYWLCLPWLAHWLIQIKTGIVGEQSSQKPKKACKKLKNLNEDEKRNVTTVMESKDGKFLSEAQDVLSRWQRIPWRTVQLSDWQRWCHAGHTEERCCTK